MKRNMWARTTALLLALSLVGCGSNNANNALSVTEEAGNTQVELSTVETTENTQDETSANEEDSTTVESSEDLAVEKSATAVSTEFEENTEAEESSTKADEKVGTNAEEDAVAQQAAEEAARNAAEEEESRALTETQKNSIAMLNYLAMLSQQINSSKNSRMYLEEAYDALINNTNPENVNELTESHLSSLLDIIEKYRMIAVKRERLEYIYNQNKAKAIKEAIPNPIGVLSAVTSFDYKRLAASVIYMAVDAVTSYNAYNTEIEQEYLQDGWELDDEEAENLHDSRKRAFLYMIDIVQEYGIPGKLALNETSIENFVTYQNKTNNAQKIQFFESEENTYSAFGSYWLELAECYYAAEEYEKCLDAISTYENVQTGIFRKDYEFAQVLPEVIVAAEEVYSGKEYVEYVEKHLKILVDNTEKSEWSLRYFAAQMYMDLYAKTKESSYLNTAFELVLNNVNYLVGEQNSMNKTYLSAVQEVTASDTATKDEKKQIKKYNKSLKEQRKIELPPVYEPLMVNCELLFALADECNISDAQKNRIDGILDSAFLTTTIAQNYSFVPENISINATYDKDTLMLPANVVSENSVIKVSVSDGGSTTVYDDWTVKEVDRANGDDDIGGFKVTYVSKSAGKQNWSADSTVKVEITEPDADDRSYILNFKVNSYKKILMVTTVEFEQVS